jgi:diphosphomevalonate decarboxylase
MVPVICLLQFKSEAYVLKKIDVVRTILATKQFSHPQVNTATAFAPSNIALCKYWGKRNSEINLPMTSSLSVSLQNFGAEITITLHDFSYDTIRLNGNLVPVDSEFSIRLVTFLNLFRNKNYFMITIVSNIPIAAGLASSACGFASVVLALNQLFGWQLDNIGLSILARLGSGSASRSIYHGLVEWHVGFRLDGMDSFADRLDIDWPELRIGLLILDSNNKKISSRQAMQRTVDTSLLYQSWPNKVANDLSLIKAAIQTKNFVALGQASMSNALAMHATMLSALPPICYAIPETVALMHEIFRLQEEGLQVYFTQDAGPNLKLLFLAENEAIVLKKFPSVLIVRPFI